MNISQDYIASTVPTGPCALPVISLRNPAIPDLAMVTPPTAPPKRPPGEKPRQLKATCDCVPPRIIRLSKTTHAQGPILCNLCAQTFEIIQAKPHPIEVADGEAPGPPNTTTSIDG